MPLAPSGLSSALEGIAANPPASVAECAQAWADAVGNYASGVVPPSLTVAAAKATLASALASAFAAPAAAPLMETAFTAFAATVSGGMAPAFVGTPPPAPVGFASQFAGPKPATHAAAGAALSSLIDTWMKTGTATPSGGGAPSPWT